MDYQCAGCSQEITEDEVIWATKDGVLNTDIGLPWCDTCLPEETTRKWWPTILLAVLILSATIAAALLRGPQESPRKPDGVMTIQLSPPLDEQ